MVMKKVILVLSLLFVHVLHAQDSTGITYTEEADTLVKQHFIDRYENVFMTKVPTKHMVKVGYVSSLLSGLEINVAYEYKILPAFSLEAGFYTESEDNNRGTNLELLRNGETSESFWLNMKARWYYNTSKRIEKGLNANNFSGSYLALSGEHNIGSGRNVQRYGLLYGFQSRFLNRGHLDFSAGLFHQPLKYAVYEANGFKVKNLVLATQYTLGVGFGDWKRVAPLPKCELLRCEEFVADQLKITFPDVKVGLKAQWFNGGIAYERKIGKAPLSLSAYVNGSFYGNSFPDYYVSPYVDVRTAAFAVGSGVQARYYFLQKKQILTGSGGNNLSGFYGGLQWQYSYEGAHVNKRDFPSLKNTHKFWQGGLMAGYQQRLFRGIFIDTNLAYLRSSFNENDYPGRSSQQLVLKVGVGFTF